MSLKEQTIILTDKDSQGNTIMQFPITKAKNIEDVMSIAQGGTGQTTASGVRNALGLGNTTGAVPIANGGTGANNASQACANIGALSTSGGAMSGDIVKSTNDKMLALRGGTGYSNGATLALYGKDEGGVNAGGFCLIAHDGTNAINFSGKPNGVLSWNGKDVERVNDIGSKYIRLESGLQICWGNTSLKSASVDSTGTITLPVAFKDTNYTVSVVSSFSAVPTNTPWGFFSIPTLTTTNFTYKRAFSEACIIRWIAIGWWR